jgi:hypothetical protein
LLAASVVSELNLASPQSAEMQALGRPVIKVMAVVNEWSRTMAEKIVEIEAESVGRSQKAGEIPNT